MTDHNKLRDLAAKATPGPWEWKKRYGEIDGLDGQENAQVFYVHTNEYIAKFIVCECDADEKVKDRVNSAGWSLLKQLQDTSTKGSTDE